MLIDAILFNGEFEMLEFRLKILDPFVDRFVIIEADHTFSGNSKLFTLDANYDRFKPYHDKILYERVIVDPDILEPNTAPPAKYDPAHQCWKIEKLQRNAIAEACINFSDDDVIMLSDVDEIPRREAIEYALSQQQLFPIVFRQHVFAYSPKHMRTIMWNGTIITTVKNMFDTSPQGLRDRRNDLPSIDHAGWHLSYFADARTIRTKIESFSHQEYNKEDFKNTDNIAYCIESGEDLFDRDAPTMTVAKENFPEYFTANAPKEWW